MLRSWSVILLLTMSVFHSGHASQNEETSQYANLDLALVKPNSKEHESWRAVHHWKSDFPPSLTSIHLISGLDWAPGLILIKGADPDATSIEVVVNHFSDTGVNLRGDFFKIEVEPDVDSVTSVMLRDPYEGPPNKIWIEMVLRLPRSRHYEIIETSAYSDTEEWTQKVENLDQFGITTDNLSLGSFKGSAYIDKVTSKEMNVSFDDGDITIASSAKTDPGSLYLRAYRGQIHIDPREDGDAGYMVNELFER